MYAVFLALLQSKGVTVADVSRATGINQSTFSNWKSRKNLLSGKNAQLVADYFGVSVDYLMTGAEQTNKVDFSVYQQDAEFLSYIQRLWSLPSAYRQDVYKALKHAERDYQEEKEKETDLSSLKEA